jgi:hypothetical protein
MHNGLFGILMVCGVQSEEYSGGADRLKGVAQNGKTCLAADERR